MSINIKLDPNFQRLRKTLLLQGKADRVPLFDWHIDGKLKENIIGRPLRDAGDEIDFWVKAGYDYVQTWLIPKSWTVKSSEVKTTQTEKSSHGMQITLEQLKSSEFPWTPLYKNTWKLEDYNYEFHKEMALKLPEDMKFIVPIADIYTDSWMTMGFEDFCYALYEDPEIIEELFRQIAIARMRLLNVMVESFGNKIGALIYADDLAYTEGLMVSSEVYRKYLWPYVREIVKVAKQLDVPIIYHSDGKLWEVLDDFVEMGINAIQPLEPKSMDLVELKQKRGHQLCLIGSIDLDLLSRGTPMEVDEMVRERIELLGYNGGYVVGASNTVPYYVNIDNYRAMLEAAFKYGR